MPEGNVTAPVKNQRGRKPKNYYPRTMGVSPRMPAKIRANVYFERRRIALKSV